MSRTRVKANLGDIWNLGSGYHDFYNVHRKDGIKGELFKFRKLSDEDIAFIKQWKNTDIVTVQYQYAPEIKSYGVVIFEKCIR